MSANPTPAKEISAGTAQNPSPDAPAAAELDIRQTLRMLRPFGTVMANVSIELGRGTLRMRDLLELKYHSIFQLDKTAGGKLDVFVNGVPLGKVEPVVVDDRLGVKIHEITGPER